jgi:4-carboxymuconolactone decarboxylase
VADYQEKLRSLTVNDEAFVEAVIGVELENAEATGLDRKTYALVRLGALLALDAAPPSYQWIAAEALDAGASVDEIVGTLIAVAPTIGICRAVAAAPELGLAIGYDVGSAFEGVEAEEGA